MRNEVQDGHPCESCLRWPECNGVDWPTCQLEIDIAKLDQQINQGLITPNEARRRLGLPTI